MLTRSLPRMRLRAGSLSGSARGPQFRTADAATPAAMLTGTLSATAVTVRIDPGIIQGWLPTGVRFSESPPDPYPLTIVWGSQHDVTAFPGGRRIPVPWRLSYAEIITAVPDLQLDPESGIDFRGPVTYLPRLYMNSWRAALLGRAVYGFSKAFARIDATEQEFRAADRRGRPLMSACIVDGPSLPAPGGPQRRLFEQPVVLKTGGDLLISRFETNLAKKPVKPVSLTLDLQPALLSYLPLIRRHVPAIDRQLDGAYQFSTAWALKPITSRNGAGMQ